MPSHPCVHDRREFLTAVAVTPLVALWWNRARGQTVQVPAVARAPDYASRRARLARLGEQAGMSGFFVPPGSSCQYLLGTSFGRSERLTAVLLGSDGKSALVAPMFEAIGLGSIDGVDQIITWQEEENPYARVAKFFSSASTPRIGIEETASYRHYVELRRALGDAALVEGSPIIDQLRMVKDAYEIEQLRAAIRPTLAVIDAVHRQVKLGMTEREISALAAQAYRDRDAGAGSWHLCQVDATAAMPHAAGSDRVLQEGSVLLIDTGTRMAGYCSDITRTVQVGQPRGAFKEVHEVVREAQRRAQAAAGPGVPCAELDRIARDVIARAGFGAAFLHRLGHGIGLDGHEPPYLVGGNECRLEVGMTFTIEPGIYLKDRFGVRIEDMFVVTENGCAALSPLTTGPVGIEPAA
ncbi:MAG: Xaa-Pro peptidase family protein [Planctomycetota bacterium]